MKKSEIYHKAMEAVVSYDINANDKVEIVEVLMAEKHLAEFSERQEVQHESV